MCVIRRFVRDERGAAAIEYSLVAALLALVVIVCVSLLGEPVGALLGGVATDLDAINDRL